MFFCQKKVKFGTELTYDVHYQNMINDIQVIKSSFMKQCLLLLSFFFSTVIAAQNIQSTFVGLQGGKHLGHDYALIKVHEKDAALLEFFFDKKNTPAAEFEVAQMSRLKEKHEDLVEWTRSGLQVHILVNASVSSNDITQLLLIISRLYGYVGFEIIE